MSLPRGAGRPLRTGLMKRLAAAALAVVLFLVLLSAVTYVGGRESAVLDPRFGQPVILSPGLHVHAPLLSRITRYSLEPRKVEGQVKVDTRDNMSFQVRFTLQAAPDPENLLLLHARRAGRLLEPVLQQLCGEAVQKASTFLRADEILGSSPKERWIGALYPPSRERGLKIQDIQVVPVESRAIVNAALLYQERNLPNAALQLAKLGVERLPQDATVHYGLGRILELQGKGQEAEDEYLQALLLDPVAREPMARMLALLLKRREFDRAQRLIEAALQKDISSAPHYNWLGIVLQLQAKYPEAETAFQKAISLDPKEADYHAGLGALYLAKGEPARAEAPLKEAIRIKPNSTIALYNLGVALAMEGKSSEAIPFFEQAERSGPPTVGLLNALAKAYTETGQTPKAAEALRKSLSLRPDQPEQQKLLKQLQAGRPSAPPRKKS